MTTQWTSPRLFELSKPGHGKVERFLGAQSGSAELTRHSTTCSETPQALVLPTHPRCPHPNLQGTEAHQVIPHVVLRSDAAMPRAVATLQVHTGEGSRLGLKSHTLLPPTLPLPSVKHRIVVYSSRSDHHLLRGKSRSWKGEAEIHPTVYL